MLASVLKTIPFFLRSESRSLESFDFSFNPSIKRTQIYELAAGQFVRQHRDVLLVGPPGVALGKNSKGEVVGYSVAMPFITGICTRDPEN